MKAKTTRGASTSVVRVIALRRRVVIDPVPMKATARASIKTDKTDTGLLPAESDNDGFLFH
ncbi:hypothetical protein [Rhizobium mongolense]